MVDQKVKLDSSSVGWTVCEIVPSLSSIPIPGPFCTIYANFLWFAATEDGRADMPMLFQEEAGEVLRSELDSVTGAGGADFEKNPQREGALERLTKQLADNGWEYFADGEYWYSKRFRRHSKL